MPRIKGLEDGRKESTKALDLSDEEAELRAREVARRMLTTPKPKKAALPKSIRKSPTR